MARLRRSPTRVQPRLTRVGDRPPTLRGVTPSGTAATVTPGDGRLVVVFLTSGCAACRALWPVTSGLADELGRRSARLVLVTPAPGAESRRAVASLAPPSVPTIMADDAWFAWGAGAAPWVVVVDDGMVVAAGTATEPADLVGLAG